VVVYNTAGVFDVSLTATNAGGSDTETKTDHITVSVPGITYCDAASLSSSYEWISKVELSNLVNSSGASTYTDFTALAANLTPGVKYTIRLTPSYTGTKYREYFRVWIDYNQDGDFADSGETVFSASRKTSATSGSFTVPTSASGSTRMRVSMRRYQYASYCGTFNYGEVEDYTVNFMAGPVGGDNGIKAEMTRESGMLLYPNPAGDLLNIQLNGLSEQAEITIYNVVGEKMIRTRISSSLHQQDISGLKPGIYFLLASDGEQVVSERFIKQ
jgi:hypothetical protein